MVLTKIKFVLLGKTLKNKIKGEVIASLPDMYFKMLYAMSLKVIRIGNVFSKHIKGKK